MYSQAHFQTAADKIKYYAASAIILNQHNEILLLLRDDIPVWMNIGGDCDPGEDFLETMHREVMEETGCSVDVVRHAGDFFCFKSGANPDDLLHERLFLCQLKADSAAPVLQDEGAKLDWFPLDNLPYNIGPQFRTILGHIFAADPASPPSLLITEPNRLDFALATTDFSNFTALDEWAKHPRVVAKREAHKLKVDPFSNAAL